VASKQIIIFQYCEAISNNADITIS